MNIIAGCSWACGEWSRGDEGAEITFPGLEYNFQQDGLDAINLGIPGGSNYAVAHKVLGYIERNPDVKIENIYVFQTEWTRDLNMIFDEDYHSVKYAYDLQNIIISRFYHRLVEIAKLTDAPVKLIGGVSDTLWLDNMEECYPGVKILCQSLVNWLLNNNSRVEIPVHSWYTQSTVEHVRKIKKLLNEEEQQKLLDMVNDGLQRETLVFSHPEFFWPDGSHPNRYVYKLIYEKLIAKKD